MRKGEIACYKQFLLFSQCSDCVYAFQHRVKENALCIFPICAKFYVNHVNLHDKTDKLLQILELLCDMRINKYHVKS